MASFVYNSAIKDAFLGRIIVGTSVFKTMLVTVNYVENQDTHTTRANITSEISGTNYTSGGLIIVPTLTQDLTTNQTKITFPALTWSNLTATGIRKAIYYVANGGAASGDYLFGINDLGADYSASGNSFNLASSEFTQTLT
jgi:hypothetical protein